MRFGVLLVLLVTAAGPFIAAPARAGGFEVGIYLDDERTTSCVVGEPGATFAYSVWAYVPDDLGLAYVTLRFAFPDNLDLSERPAFHRLMRDVIITEYPLDTVEWNMIFDECPSGWIEVFRQECVLLDDQESRIAIQAEHSMLRDCTFVLNDVTVRDELAVNDPGCSHVGSERRSWSSLKGMFR